MTTTLLENAHAVLLPAFASTHLSDGVKRFLENGGISVLLGETREEYVARTVSDRRKSEETPETFLRVSQEVRSSAGQAALVLVDQEPGGICRLHDLVPQFPESPDIVSLSSQELEDMSFTVGKAAAALGVNVFIAPVLDILSGPNPWLAGRTLSSDPSVVARVSSAYIKGVQKAGVAATAKHFPGFHNIALDPAIEQAAMNGEPAKTYEPGFIPFREAIAVGVEMIMVGPAVVRAFDEKVAALRSKPVIDMLKNDFGFGGIVMADDLDSRATMRGDPIDTVAIDALKAGCDYLLLADVDDQIAEVASAVATAAQEGVISAEALAKSAERLRSLASRYNPTA